MLDIKFIRENADKVKDACSKKGIDANVIDQLLDWDLQRRELVAGVDALRAAKNAVSLDIAKMSADEKASKLLEMKEVDSRQTEMEAKLREVQKQFDALMLQIPNIPAPEVPVGKDDSGNIDYSILDDSSINKLSQGMRINVRQSLLIEFEADDYKKGSELVNQYRKENYIGGFLINKLEEYFEKNKSKKNKS
jgi:seryl-tRNA synthetase